MIDDPDERVVPTPERLAKAGPNESRGFVLVDGREAYTYRLTDSSPLEALYELDRRDPGKGITGPEYQAGSRYFASAFHAGVLASGVPDLTQERVDGGGHKGVADWRLEAAQSYAMALKSLDRLAAAVLHHVVLMERPLAEFAEVSRFPQARERRAIALHNLRYGLGQLVAHYDRLDGNVQRRTSRIEVMHEDGYRPYIPKGGAADDR